MGKSKHHLTHAQEIWGGRAYLPRHRVGEEGRKGVGPMALAVEHDYGVLATADPDAVALAQLPAGPGNLTLNGVAVTNGIAAFDAARNITITGVAATTAANFTITGYDQYGHKMVETFAGPVGATTVQGNKAFWRVTQVATDAGTTGNVTVGFGDKVGFPFRVDRASQVMAYSADTLDTAPTFAFADATDPATAATGDTRGTITFTDAPNGARRFGVVIFVSQHGTRKEAYGVPQFAG